MTASAPGLPLVWFEREVPAGLVAEVDAVVRVLGPATRDDPWAGLTKASAAVVSMGGCDGAFMDRAPALRVIARTGIGYDRVDVAEATRRGIAVCNTPDGPTISTAEHAAALMLMVAKNVKRSEAELRAGEGDLYGRHVAIELQGKRLGLVGFGRIARHLAAIARGLGMRLSAYDPFLAASDFAPPVTREGSLDHLLADADVISVHVPLTAATQGMFSAGQFARMKPGGVFINTARGGLVDGAALLAALEAGHLFGAGLDVTDPEPLPPGHPLLLRQDVVITPHVASGSVEGKVRIFRTALEQVMQALSGRRPTHLVNPEVWDG